MNRFFVDPSDAQGDLVRIADPGDVAHLVRVLRVRPGERAIAVAAGEELVFEVLRLEAAEVVGRVVSRTRPRREPPLRVILVQGLPKTDKMDLVVQKATELGVSGIVPVHTERSVKRLEDGRAEPKLRRWRRIARESARQSGRLAIPDVREVTDLETALQAAAQAGSLLLFPWEQEGGRGLREILQAAPEPRPSVHLFIGPEGGFSPAEAELAQRAGAWRVSLGPRILRTETAGLAALAMVLYELGDLGRPGEVPG